VYISVKVPLLVCVPEITLEYSAVPAVPDWNCQGANENSFILEAIPDPPNSKEPVEPDILTLSVLFV